VVARILLNPGAAVNPRSPILNLVDSIRSSRGRRRREERSAHRPGQAGQRQLEAFPGETSNAR